MIYELSYGKWGPLISLVLQNVVTYHRVPLPDSTEGVSECFQPKLPLTPPQLTLTFTHPPHPYRILSFFNFISWLWNLHSDPYSAVPLTEYAPEALPHMVIKELQLISSYYRIKRSSVLQFVVENSPQKILKTQDETNLNHMPCWKGIWKKCL